MSLNYDCPPELLGAGQGMLNAMIACIGEHETNGDNTNDITEWYGLNDAWCDMTITWAAWHSGNAQNVCGNVKQDYTVDHAQWFADNGAWVPMTHGVAGSGIRKSDVIFFDWSGGVSIGGIDHVGLVESVNGSVVNTIEGNISNVCKRMQRTVEVIAGFGRPVYSTASTPPPVDNPPPPSHSTECQPFPGADWFHARPNSPIVTEMGKRLVANGCSAYQVGPGPQWGDADQASYARWQRKLGYSGFDADGWPGATSWAALRVPKVSQ